MTCYDESQNNQIRNLSKKSEICTKNCFKNNIFHDDETSIKTISDYIKDRTSMVSTENHRDSIKKNNKKCIILSGPSGSGKSTISKRLLNDIDTKDLFRFSISHTTREKRKDEIDGKDYFFVTKEEFTTMIEKNEFIEYAIYNGNYYGTSIKQFIEKTPESNKDNFVLRDENSFLLPQNTFNDNKILILDLERQGVKHLVDNNFNCIFIFIFCEKNELKKRLIKRIGKNNLSFDENSEIENRLNEFDKDMEFSRSGIYDLCVKNENLEDSVVLIKEFIINKLN